MPEKEGYPIYSNDIHSTDAGEELFGICKECEGECLCDEHEEDGVKGE